MSASTYALDNAHEQAEAHHRALAAALDPQTQARIEALPRLADVGDVLELGAGGGSISLRLAQKGMRVTAADLNPARLPQHPNLFPVQVDLTAGEPLAQLLGTGHDMIIGRMTFMHLENRDELLPQVVELLDPDHGVLLLEDWAAYRPEQQPPVVCAPTAGDEKLWTAYQHTIADLFDQSGADRLWAKRVYPAMLAAGLVEVDTIYSGGYWRGGDAGMTLVATTCAQLRPRLLQAGWTDEQLQRIVELTTHPAMVVHGHPLYSTIGFRRR